MTPHFSRRARLPLLAVALAVWSGCADSDRISAPGIPQQNLGAFPEDVRAAIAAQERHTPAFMAVSGVVGTAVGLAADGRPVIQVFLAHGNVPPLPLRVDGIAVQRVVTGEFHARSNPLQRARPAPLGYSVGHPLITAGSIGARVRDAAGNVFILSNNHVLANSNDAANGNATLQPGPFDGGRDPADRIGTLHAFQVIDFGGGDNVMDAAIALTTADAVGSSSPEDDGYGMPLSALFNDANNDLRFDDVGALLNVRVQKYGRTTKLTRGTITGINGIINVCYEVLIIFCVKSARFVDQLIITPGSFSGSGDSGSMIVTDPAKHPIALLFAGSSSNTIANRMDHVLRRFNVRIDAGDPGEPPPPPPSVTDVAVTALSAPAAVTQGGTASISVVLQNVGSVAVPGDVTLTLTDDTDNQVIGSTVISGGLAAGATATRNFSWNTSSASTGTHVLTARHDVSDDDAGNDARSASVTVNPASAEGIGLHFSDLDGFSITQSGGKWIARVRMEAHGPNHEVLPGAALGGMWSDGVEFTCYANDFGVCLAERTLRKQTASIFFIVAGIVYGLTPFTPEYNHDPDGDSDGTMIVVNRP